MTPPTARVCSWLRTAAATAVAVVLGGSVAQAQPTDARADECPPGATAELGLETLLRAALAEHPLLASASQEIVSAEARRLAADGAFDPVARVDSRQMLVSTYRDHETLVGVDALTPIQGIRAGAGYRYHTGYIPDYYGYRETGSIGELRAHLEAPILEGRAIDPARASVRIADEEQQAAGLVFAFERIRIAREAARAWWDWQTALEVRSIRAALLHIAEDRLRMVGARVTAGDVAAVDEIEARRTVLQRRSRLVEADRDVDVTAAALAFWLRDRDGRMRLPNRCERPGWRSVDETTTASWAPRRDELDALEELRRPDIERFEALRRIAEVQADVARNRILPILDVRGWVAQQLGDELPRPNPTDAGVGLRFSLPIGNRSARGARDQALALADRLEADQRVVREAALRDLEIARVRLERAQERLGIVTRELDTLAELEEAERVAWLLGESTLFLVNLRETTTAEAREMQAHAARDVWQARIDLQATRGDEPESWSGVGGAR